MAFVRHSNEVEYVYLLSDWLQMGVDTGTLDLACCCLLRSFDSYYLSRDADEYDRELDPIVGQRTNEHGFFIG